MPPRPHPLFQAGTPTLVFTVLRKKTVNLSILLSNSYILFSAQSQNHSSFIAALLEINSLPVVYRCCFIFAMVHELVTIN